MSVKTLNQDRPTQTLTLTGIAPTNAAAERIDLRGLRGGMIKVGTGIVRLDFYVAFNTSDTPGILADTEDNEAVFFNVTAGQYYSLPVNDSYGAPYLFVKSDAAGSVEVYTT